MKYKIKTQTTTTNEIDVELPEFFESTGSYFMCGGDMFTKVYIGMNKSYLSIQLTDTLMTHEVNNAQAITREQFFEKYCEAVELSTGFKFNPVSVTLSEASNHSFQQAVEMTEHPELTGMILNAYDKVLNDMKSEREDNELDEQGNNK